MATKLVTKPLGARVFVEELIDDMSIVERGKLSNITIITDEVNKPRPTAGTVVAMGTDPMIVELGLREGSLVAFGRNSGTYVTVKGKTVRSLELQEIISVTNEEEFDEEGIDTIDVFDNPGSIGNESKPNPATEAVNSDFAKAVRDNPKLNV